MYEQPAHGYLQRRSNALKGRIKVDIANMMYDTLADLAEAYQPSKILKISNWISYAPLLLSQI